MYQLIRGALVAQRVQMYYVWGYVPLPLKGGIMALAMVQESVKNRSSFQPGELARISDRGPLGHQVWKWRKRVELQEDADISDDIISKKIGLSRSVWSRVINGKHEPMTPRAICQALAEFFGRYFPDEATEEKILRLVGYATYESLIEYVRKHPARFEESIKILSLLGETQHLSWRSSVGGVRRQADKVLQSTSLTEEEKAIQIAALVDQWQQVMH
jgi:hypothetical protein